MTTKKKKPNENDDEISVCEVECQTHGDDTDSVAIEAETESCETEPCSSSITDSTYEVECQTHGDNTDSVAIEAETESCETEPSYSSSITDSTYYNVKNSELDEKLLKQDMRRFSSLKYEQSFPWLYYSSIKSGYLCKFCELFQTDPTNSSILYVNCGVDLGTHPTRKLEYNN